MLKNVVKDSTVDFLMELKKKKLRVNPPQSFTLSSILPRL